MTRVSHRQPTVLSIFNMVPNKIGGVEAYARELSRQLGEKGWRSVLCFLASPPAKVGEYLDLPNVVLESLDDAVAGVAYHFRLFKMLQRYKPEILHLHFFSVLGPYAWLARCCGVRKIFFTDRTSRPEGFVGNRRPLWKCWLFRATMMPVTRIFCVSHYVRKSFDSLELLPKNRVSVIYNGVDLERAAAGMTRGSSFRTSLGLDADVFLVVQVGQIIAEKGVSDLLNAAKRVCAENRNVYFLFVGDGPSLKEYRELADRLGLTGKVDFSGPLPDPLAEGVFAAADLVCQVSRWEEAFGLVIAEAMASARPVLATRCGGIPELVCDGKTGYKIDRGDVESMASRILELSYNRPQAFAFGVAGQTLCREKFDYRINVAQLLSYYEI